MTPITIRGIILVGELAGNVEVEAMKLSWQTEADHLACRWSEVGQHVEYNPLWMQETTIISSGYLPPVPDFASHSPFGGLAWFQPRALDLDRK